MPHRSTSSRPAVLPQRASSEGRMNFMYSCVPRGKTCAMYSAPRIATANACGWRFKVDTMRSPPGFARARENLQGRGRIRNVLEHLHAGDRIEGGRALAREILRGRHAVVDANPGLQCVQFGDLDQGGRTDRVRARAHRRAPWLRIECRRRIPRPEPAFRSVPRRSPHSAAAADSVGAASSTDHSGPTNSAQEPRIWLFPPGRHFARAQSCTAPGPGRGQRWAGRVAQTGG